MPYRLTRSHILAALAIVVVCLLPGCERSVDSADDDSTRQNAADAGRPNVLLVVVCTCRYANLSVSGYDRGTTPFLKSLAETGVTFENAVAASSWTKPSVTSILTGLTPNVHRMTDYYDYTVIRAPGFAPKRMLADEIVTLGECLARQGYATFYRGNNIHAGHYFNIAQGFPKGAQERRRFGATLMLRDFRDWLGRQDKTKPFFFYMLTADPHLPYAPAKDVFDRFDRSSLDLSTDRAVAQHAAALRTTLTKMEKSKTTPDQVPAKLKEQWVDLYDAELAQLDKTLSAIPRILAEAGRADDTLIVVTADHGERLFDGGGLIGHSRSLSEAVLHIPLIFNGPGVQSGVSVQALARSIDIYPTIAAIAGAEMPPVIQGRNLLPLFAPNAPDPNRSAFASYRERAHVVQRGRYKLYSNPGQDSPVFRLFDLQTDPGEQHDILATNLELAGELQALLDEWLIQESSLREFVGEGEKRELTPEAIEQLRGLGYIGGN